ncbi:MAG: hypothetical protein R3E66_06675 [bacterium]
MNVTDELGEELESQSSGGGATLSSMGRPGSAALLALALAGCAYASGNDIEYVLPTPVEQHETSGTSSPSTFEVSTYDVLAALQDVIRGLDSQQVDLDDEAKRVLYENRWDLYE